MEMEGVVHNGVIVPDNAPALPEGTRVRIVVVPGGEPPVKASFDQWKHDFDVWMAAVQARAKRYPPGFVLDDSRESMYHGCGE